MFSSSIILTLDVSYFKQLVLWKYEAPVYLRLVVNIIITFPTKSSIFVSSSSNGISVLKIVQCKLKMLRFSKQINKSIKQCKNKTCNYKLLITS